MCDVGSGTGCTGIIAAALGGTSTLTDQKTVQALLQENIALCSQLLDDPEKIILAEFDWDASPNHLAPPLILYWSQVLVLYQVYIIIIYMMLHMP